VSQSWQGIALRIDALSLRERAFIFFSVIVICLALVDTLWITPARQAHKQLTQRFASESQELLGLRNTLKTKVDQPDPGKVVRQEVQRVQADIAKLDSEILAAAGSTAAGGSLRELMVQFLRSQPGLTLVRTGTLATDSASTANAKPASATLERQSLELTVAGPYGELARYVDSLEKAMPQLRWGPMKLSAEQQPPQLSLQVYLVRPVP
jgi:MSHA biogenesis protein MshJ